MRVGSIVKLKQGTVIFDGVVVNPGSTIGELAILNTSSLIDHDSQIGDFVHIAPEATVCGGVVTGNNSFILAGAMVLNCMKIGENCFIGAGVAVVNDCLEETTYLGVPARPAH